MSSLFLYVLQTYCVMIFCHVLLYFWPFFSSHCVTSFLVSYRFSISHPSSNQHLCMFPSLTPIFFSSSGDTITLALKHFHPSTFAVLFLYGNRLLFTGEGGGGLCMTFFFISSSITTSVHIYHACLSPWQQEAMRSQQWGGRGRWRDWWDTAIYNHVHYVLLITDNKYSQYFNQKKTSENRSWTYHNKLTCHSISS